MIPRFEDLRDTQEGTATLLGGTNTVDIWLSIATDGVVPGKHLPVLICQYEDNNDYVSYHPPGAILDHVKGTLQDSKEMDVQGTCISTWPEGTRTYWHSGEMEHNALEIARYLAVFAPDVFSDAEREEVLGMTLTMENGR
jgi:hypothetical protein